MTDYEQPYWGLLSFYTNDFRFISAWSMFTTDPRRSVWAPGRVKKEVASEKETKKKVDQELFPLVGGPKDGEFVNYFMPKVKCTVAVDHYRFVSTFYYMVEISIGAAIKDVCCFYRHETLSEQQSIEVLFGGYFGEDAGIRAYKRKSAAVPAATEGENMNFKVMSVDELFEELEEGVPISEFAEHLLEAATAEEEPAEEKKEAEKVVDQEFIPIIGGPLDGQFGGPESKLNNYRLIHYNNFHYFFKHNSFTPSQFLDMLLYWDCSLDKTKFKWKGVAARAINVIPGYNINGVDFQEGDETLYLYKQLFSAYLKSRGR